MEVINSDSTCKSRFTIPASGLFALILTLMVLGWNPLNAQPTLEVEATQVLDFGSFVTGTTGGTVVVSPNGNRIVTGTILGLASPISAAEFTLTVKGRARDIHYSFSEPSQLTRIGGGGSMTITNFTSDKPGNYFSSTPSSQTYHILVGATLNVQNSPPGSYTGTFTITFIEQ